MPDFWIGGQIGFWIWVFPGDWMNLVVVIFAVNPVVPVKPVVETQNFASLRFVCRSIRRYPHCYGHHPVF
jgi:hypothetical protein